MIEVFKILNKLDEINPEVLFEINDAKVTRGNGMQLKVQRYNTIARKSYFNVRVVDHWNRLQASVVSYKTIDIFKFRLDKHFRGTGFNRTLALALHKEFNRRFRVLSYMSVYESTLFLNFSNEKCNVFKSEGII